MIKNQTFPSQLIKYSVKYSEKKKRKQANRKMKKKNKTTTKETTNFAIIKITKHTHQDANTAFLLLR